MEILIIVIAVIVIAPMVALIAGVLVWELLKNMFIALIIMVILAIPAALILNYRDRIAKLSSVSGIKDEILACKHKLKILEEKLSASRDARDYKSIPKITQDIQKNKNIIKKLESRLDFMAKKPYERY